MQGVIRPAPGWAQGPGSRRFVSFQLAGAPPRWMYDFFPVAYGQENFDRSNNLSIATNYASSGGRYTEPEFSTVSVKGLNTPPFWQLSVPAAGGGLRRVDGLLDNLLSIQGVNTSVDGHETCQRLHWQPVAGVQSRAALAADGSSAPLSAVSIQASSFSFQSVRDKSVVPLDDLEENPLASLLQPFLTTLPSVDPSRRAATTAAEQALDGEAASWASSAVETQASQDAAFSLFARGFGNLDATFQQRVGVYRDLIRRALDMTMAGFTDLPVGRTGRRGVMYSVGVDGGDPVATPDLRTMFGPETNILGLAEQFVVVGISSARRSVAFAGHRRAAHNGPGRRRQSFRRARLRRARDRRDGVVAAEREVLRRAVGVPARTDRSTQGRQHLRRHGHRSVGGIRSIAAAAGRRLRPRLAGQDNRRITAVASMDRE